MISGARQGRTAGLRRLISAAMSRDLSAIVVPGAEVARARGLDVEGAGLRLAASPRHASVLVVVGELPQGLREAAAVLYSQMMRPRAILAVGEEEAPPLPAPDVRVEPSQQALSEGVARLRSGFARGAFAPEVEDFDAEMLNPEVEYVCPMHPEVVSGEPGSCPKCGMDLVAREAQQGGGDEEDDSGHDEDQGDHDHEEMDHGEMDFMSMIEMTKDLPPSADGLRMDWVEIPFGPLFPGLPGGLLLMLTLDGDTVAGATAESVAGGVEISAGEAASFAGHLAALDPLSPGAYRVLALRAMEDAAGAEANEETARLRAGALERERAVSHLNWLSGFAYLIGNRWLYRRAAELQLAVLRSEVEEVESLRSEVQQLRRRVERTPLLRRRLRGIGPLPGDAGVSGPVARAAGIMADARLEDPAYLTLGFEPVVREGDDALSRLRVRLAEVEQSLRLASAADSVGFPGPVIGDAACGMGEATVETPRGPARLRLTLEGGKASVELETPSSALISAIPAIVEGQELGDALAGVASLDISPWGVAR